MGLARQTHHLGHQIASYVPFGGVPFSGVPFSGFDFKRQNVNEGVFVVLAFLAVFWLSVAGPSVPLAQQSIARLGALVDPMRFPHDSKEDPNLLFGLGDSERESLDDDAETDLEASATSDANKTSDANDTSASNDAKDETLTTDTVLTRRLRIERILMTLDGIAQVALQMSPDQALRIEPVLVDLAEQTIELSDEDLVRTSDADRELNEIENTVDELVAAIEKMVEPEHSL